MTSNDTRQDKQPRKWSVKEMRKTTVDTVSKDNLLVDISGLTTICACGRATTEKIGAEAQAVVRIGKRKLYKVDRVNAYLETLCQ